MLLKEDPETEIARLEYRLARLTALEDAKTFCLSCDLSGLSLSVDTITKRWQINLRG